VWKRGHRESDRSNTNKLCSSIVEAQLVSY
jgi:hypothetical protein